MRKKFRFIFISTIYLADAACGQHSPRAQFIHVVRISVPLRCVQMRRRQKSSAIPNLLSVKWLNGTDVDFQLCSHYIFEDTCRSTSQPTHPIRWLCARPWRALRFSSFFFLSKIRDKLLVFLLRLRVSRDRRKSIFCSTLLAIDGIVQFAIYSCSNGTGKHVDTYLEREKKKNEWN